MQYFVVQLWVIVMNKTAIFLKLFYFRYDYIDVQELLAAREESRRKVQENQLRRRSIISNFSRRWTRKTITNPGSNTR